MKRMIILIGCVFALSGCASHTHTPSQSDLNPKAKIIGGQFVKIALDAMVLLYSYLQGGGSANDLKGMGITGTVSIVDKLSQSQYTINDHCEGALGSVLDPMSLEKSLNRIGFAVDALPIFSTDFGNFDIASLKGNMRKFHVYQGSAPLCWAASLETVRKYKGLTSVSKEKISETVGEKCPRLKTLNQGAQPHEIMMAINIFSQKYGESVRAPVMCSRFQCIIESLQRGAPLIVGRQGHVVVVYRIDFSKFGQNTIFLHRFYFIDPAERVPTRRLVTMTGLEFMEGVKFVISYQNRRGAQ